MGCGNAPTRYLGGGARTLVRRPRLPTVGVRSVPAPSSRSPCRAAGLRAGPRHDERMYGVRLTMGPRELHGRRCLLPPPCHDRVRRPLEHGLACELRRLRHGTASRSCRLHRGGLSPFVVIILNTPGTGPLLGWKTTHEHDRTQAVREAGISSRCEAANVRRRGARRGRADDRRAAADDVRRRCVRPAGRRVSRAATAPRRGTGLIVGCGCRAALRALRA